MENVCFIQDMRVFSKVEKAIEYSTTFGKSKYHFCSEDNIDIVDNEDGFDEFVKVDFYSDEPLRGESDIEFANFNGQVVIVRKVPMD
jgi:uncharacterized protein YfeS